MDLIDEKREDYYFTRTNKRTGQLEQVCMLTGKVTSLVCVKRGESNDVAMYNKEVAGAICELVRSGKSIAEIARTPGYPESATIYNWKRLFPGFEEKLEASFKDRSYHFQDQIIDELDGMSGLTKDEVPGMKLKIDTAFKLMEKANPEKFGNKVQLSGDKNAPLQFIVDTGVRSFGDEGFDEDKFNAIDANFTKVQDEGASGDETEDSIVGCNREQSDSANSSVENLAEEIREVSSRPMGKEE